MMTENDKDPIFRVIFNQNGQLYEVYARSLTDDTMVGFIQVEELVFTDEEQIIVDPSTEKLRQEFKDVDCVYIPLHHVLRIDEVHKTGAAKVKQLGSSDGSNVSPFPMAHLRERYEQD